MHKATQRTIALAFAGMQTFGTIIWAVHMRAEEREGSVHSIPDTSCACVGLSLKNACCSGWRRWAAFSRLRSEKQPCCRSCGQELSHF